jgi:hypothetical protein
MTAGTERDNRGGGSVEQGDTMTSRSRAEIILVVRSLLVSIVCISTLGASGASAQWRGAPWADYSAFISEIDGSMEANLRAIAAVGESMGREPGRMGQIGDSITSSFAYFRNAILVGPTANETGHDYGPVRSWLSYNNQLPADANSFYRDHGKDSDYGNQSGWRLSNCVAYGHPDHCVNEGDGDTPGNFSWVLIMFGTNDIDSINWEAVSWGNAYEDFVQDFIDLGIVPVVSTIPPEQAHVGDGKVQAANQQILEVAAALNIPFVDYYALVLHYQPTNWVGTLISNDGTHPSAGGGGQDFSQAGLTTTDGYAARTKLTFDVAEILRDRVFPPSSLVESASWGAIKEGYRSE